MADVKVDTKEKRVPVIDNDYDPSMLDIDDEQTLDDEEALSNDSCNEIDDLQKESEMPIEELLAAYGRVSPSPSYSDLNVSLSSEDDILSNEDLTLDKDEIGRDLLISEDKDTERPTSADDLMRCVDVSPARTDKSELTPLLSRPLRQALLSSSVCKKIIDADSDDDSSDADYVPIENPIIPEELWKKTISVGSDFQATLPCISSHYDPQETDDELMWDPNSIENDESIVCYLNQVERIRDESPTDVGDILFDGINAKDDEVALKILMDRGDKEVALDTLYVAINEKQLHTLKSRVDWAISECIKFEEAFYHHGKNFFKMKIESMNHRTVSELVEFYYNWKKTERYDNYLTQHKRRPLFMFDPNSSDFVERYKEIYNDSNEDDIEVYAEKLPNITCTAEELAYSSSSEIDINIDETYSNTGSSISDLHYSTPEPTLAINPALVVKLNETDGVSPNNNCKRTFEFSIDPCPSVNKRPRKEDDYILSVGCSEASLMAISQSAVSAE